MLYDLTATEGGRKMRIGRKAAHEFMTIDLRSEENGVGVDLMVSRWVEFFFFGLDVSLPRLLLAAVFCVLSGLALIYT